MKQFLMCALAVSAMISTVSAQTKTKVPVKSTTTKTKVSVAAPIMKNLNDSFSYAAGLNIGQSMKEQGITDLNSSLVQKAMDDVLKNRKQLLTPEQANMTLQEQLQAYAMKKRIEEKAKNDAFFTENKKRPGVVALPSGLQYEILKAGDPSGIKPTIIDTVEVHYVGSLTNGNVFESSVSRGESVTFALNRVIRGWTEALQLMTKGAKWKVFIPSELGYGDAGSGQIPPGATLIFEIELLEVKPAVTQ